MVPRQQGAPVRPHAPRSDQLYQKVRRITRFRPGPLAVQRIRRYKQQCGRLVCRVPYQQYITAIAADLKSSSGNQRGAVHTLHKASQAYLKGLKDETGEFCCGPAAKRESTNFLLCLAWMGLKQMISFVSKDKELQKKIKKESPVNDAHHHHHHHHHNHEHHHNHQHDHAYHRNHEHHHSDDHEHQHSHQGGQSDHEEDDQEENLQENEEESIGVDPLEVEDRENHNNIMADAAELMNQQVAEDNHQVFAELGLD